MTVTTCPQFSDLDQEIIEDFSACLRENIEAIELCINTLDSESNPELIHQLFRDIHSFKGNCRMVLLEPVAEPIHAMEELVSEMRQGSRSYSPIYGEFFMAVILQIEAMIHAFSSRGEIPGTPQNDILNLIISVQASDSGHDHQTIDKALDALARSHLNPATQNSGHQTTPDKEIKTSNVVMLKSSESAAPVKDEGNADLAFFKGLSLKMEEAGIYKTGRTETLLSLCASTNEQLGMPVCLNQLSAAVYMHDIGMALVHRSILEKKDELSHDENKSLQHHIDTGSQLLQKIPGWKDAVIIVEQHHEKFNGNGYPNGISGDDIHPGAMILALADTFFKVANERPDRSFKKSLFSAMTLINGENGMHFNPRFVEAFNETVRHHYIKR